MSRSHSGQNHAGATGRPSALPFNAEGLGGSLRQLAVDVVQGEKTDFISRWFKSDSGEIDLVIWTDSEKRVIKHQLCFYGQVVEWNPINGTRTGLVVEEEIVRPQTEDQVSETIRFDKLPDDFVVNQATRMLAKVPELLESERRALIYNLRESPKLHKKARERALKAWAPKIEEIHSDLRPSFWNRFKRWFSGD